MDLADSGKEQLEKTRKNTVKREYLGNRRTENLDPGTVGKPSFMRYFRSLTLSKSDRWVLRYKTIYISFLSGFVIGCI